MADVEPEKFDLEKAASLSRENGPLSKRMLAGCSTILVIAAVAIAIIIAMTRSRSDEPKGTADPVTESPSSATSPSPSVTASESPSESPSRSPDGPPYLPPDEDDLPEDAELFRGSSGITIGCIACDGQSRFVNIRQAQLVVGDANRAQVETVWDRLGTVVEFGASLSGPNAGRYGFNLFANGTTYLNGCSMEIGQTSCRQQTRSSVGPGMRIAIIIGEAGVLTDDGRPASEGDFVVDWWFVFHPG